MRSSSQNSTTPGPVSSASIVGAAGACLGSNAGPGSARKSSAAEEAAGELGEEPSGPLGLSRGLWLWVGSWLVGSGSWSRLDDGRGRLRGCVGIGEHLEAAGGGLWVGFGVCRLCRLAGGEPVPAGGGVESLGEVRELPLTLFRIGAQSHFSGAFRRTPETARFRGCRTRRGRGGRSILAGARWPPTLRRMRSTAPTYGGM